MLTRPLPDEYASYFDDYVHNVPEGSDIFALLSRQPDELRTLLQALPDTQANVRPAPGEWSVKEVMGHLCDLERIWAFEGLHCARGDTTPLPIFDYEAYMRSTDFNTRSLTDLIDEFTLHRRANVLCFKALTEAETLRRGTADDAPMSARARLYIMIGHVMHHIESLKTVYAVMG